VKDQDSLHDKGHWTRAERQAAQWLARWDHAGEQDAASLQQEFDLWLAAHAAHQAAYARLVGLIEPAHQLRQPVNIQEADLAVPAVWPRRELLWAGAKGLAALALGGGGFAVQALAWSTQSSAVGENRPLVLPDGCMARLNTDSQVSWRFHSDRREIWLERGEMALVVVPAVTCQLSIASGLLRLHSGRFNLRLRDGALGLLVLHGRAEYVAQEHHAPVIAQTGQSLLMAENGPKLRLFSEQERDSSLAWQNGEILFQNDSLGNAVAEYNRYLRQKIVLVDRDLANILVGGRFTTADPSDFLKSLELGLGLQVIRQGGNILVAH
jgi:transmembrane sensor